MDEYALYYEAFARHTATSARRTRALIIIILNLWMAIYLEIVGALDQSGTREPYHTSALSGVAWVMELLTGHPKRIRTELGVTHSVFTALIEELQRIGITGSRYVTLEEQLAIFLYMSVTGMTIRHAGERFQRSNGTIATYVPLNCL